MLAVDVAFLLLFFERDFFGVFVLIDDDDVEMDRVTGEGAIAAAVPPCLLGRRDNWLENNLGSCIGVHVGVAEVAVADATTTPFRFGCDRPYGVIIWEDGVIWDRSSWSSLDSTSSCAYRTFVLSLVCACCNS